MALFRLRSRINNFATMTLSPPGTPLWHPQKDDFAPRLGVACQREGGIENCFAPNVREHTLQPPAPSPVSYLAVVDPNHGLPRTYEWNAAVERSLGKAAELLGSAQDQSGDQRRRYDR